MEHQITIKSLVHSFPGLNVLDDASFECNTGQITGIFGRNGAGKSTLFNILFGTLKPNEADIYLDGKPFIPNKKQGDIIGYHTQHIMLPKLSTVKDLISVYLPVSKRDEVYFAPGVDDMRYKRIHQLSLGQQRYLQFLLILSIDHPFLILDEPFSMVEPLYKNLIKEKLLEHKAKKGFLISDHYYRDILDIADKSFLLKDGKMISIQSNKELVELGYLSVQAIL